MREGGGRVRGAREAPPEGAAQQASPLRGAAELPAASRLSPPAAAGLLPQAARNGAAREAAHAEADEQQAEESSQPIGAHIRLQRRLSERPRRSAVP